MPTTTDNSRFSAVMRGPGSMRQANEWVVLERLQLHAPVSAPQLSAATGLSRPTVNLALARLEEAGLVRQGGVRTGRAGRAARLWVPNADAGRVVAVDVGTRCTRLALADLCGTVIERREEESSRTGDATGLVQQIARLVTGLLDDNEVARQDVYSIVIGSPGIYDPDSRRVQHAANLPGWDRPAVVALLAEELGDRVQFENDVDLAALGEQAEGLGRGVDDFVYLTIGSGIGLGTVAGGRLHRGARGAAGEIAFLLVGDGPGDPVGDVRERGMFESAVAADAVTAAARAAGLGPDRTLPDVLAAADGGNPAAERIVARQVDLLARALIAVVTVVDPELIVLGGDVAGPHTERLLLEPLRHRLRTLVPLLMPRLAVSAVGADATLLGGLAQAVDAAWQRAYALSQAPAGTAP